MKINEYLKIKEAAKFLGVSLFTLRNWEKLNKISVYRNPINKYRLYKKEDLEKILKESGEWKKESPKFKCDYCAMVQKCLETLKGAKE